MNRISRRKLVLALMLVVALLLSSAQFPTKAQDKFVYWGGLIFSEEANNAFVKRIEAWGQARGKAVEVVMINQNELVQRVSAAIEAGTLPDAMDVAVDFALLLAGQNQLEPLDAVYEEVGKAHGGWQDAAQQLVSLKDFGGKIYGVPFGLSGNVLFRRHDELEKAGFTEAPATWTELAEMAAKAQNPPATYGMGFALSNVGDGNLTTTMLQAWGGRVADDAGKMCTLDSPETRAFLEWITKAFSDGLFPPGATTWDGAGDNTAYQSGNALFIANPGSVYVWMRTNDPQLLEGSRFSALPAGPKMRIVPVSAWMRGVPAKSRFKEDAADLIKWLADEDFMNTYHSAAIYGPALKDYEKFAIFTDSPVHVGLLELARNGAPGGFPDVNNKAFAEYQTNFLTPKMVQRVVVDKISIDDAVKETQAACQAIYDKYK